MKIPILSYHSISNENCHLSLNLSEFNKQLKYFKNNNFKKVYYDEIKNNNRKQFIITFDDGYKDLILNALPILKKYNFKATCYLVSNLIGKKNIWDEKNKNIREKNLMNFDDIKFWMENGMKVGSHSKNHKRLIDLNKQELKEEIIQSKYDLEDMLNCSIDSFCYPYGLYNENVMDIVKKNYDFALSTRRSRLNYRTHNKFLLPRIDMGKEISFLKMFLKIKTPYEDFKFN